MADKRGAYRFLVGSPDRKRTLERCRRRWKDNIKISLQKNTWARTGSIGLRIGRGGGLL
jgi:hypothetical protein